MGVMKSITLSMPAPYRLLRGGSCKELFMIRAMPNCWGKSKGAMSRSCTRISMARMLLSDASCFKMSMPLR